MPTYIEIRTLKCSSANAKVLDANCHPPFIFSSIRKFGKVLFMRTDKIYEVKSVSTIYNRVSRRFKRQRLPGATLQTASKIGMLDEKLEIQ